MQMQRTNGSCVPSPLDGVITALMERAADHVTTGVDHTDAVEDLVAASRWNPALLMVATERADKCFDHKLEPAVENLRVAEQRVRQRMY